MKRIFNILLVMAFLVVGYGCGSNTKVVDEKDYANVFKNVEDFKGQKITLTGQVAMEPERDGDNVILKVNHDFEDSKSGFVVKVKSDVTFKKDDYIKTTGIIAGEYETTDRYDEKITVPSIDGKEIEKVSLEEAFSPTIHEVELNETKTIDDVDLTITKVQFTSKETRVYLKVNNNSKDDVDIFYSNIKALVDSTEYKAEPEAAYRYEMMDYDIKSGEEVRGLMVLGPIEDFKGKEINFKFEMYNTTASDIKDFSITTKIK